MKKKFAILLVLLALIITGCSWKTLPPDTAETAVTTGTIAEVTTVAETVAVTEETITLDEVAKREKRHAEIKKEFDCETDIYLTAIKDKKLSEYYSDNDDGLDRYFDGVVFEEIRRSDGNAVIDEWGSFSCVEYDITMVISESDREEFPVGKSEWHMINHGSLEHKLYSKGKEPDYLSYSGAYRDKPDDVTMSFAFLENFDYECEDISKLCPDSDDEQDVYNYYLGISNFLFLNDVYIKSEQEYYDAVEQMLGITGLDVNEFELYREWGAEALCTQPKNAGHHAALNSRTEDENGYTVVLDIYADEAWLVVAKSISYRVEKTNGGLRLVSAKIIEDNGCTPYWWSN